MAIKKNTKESIINEAMRLFAVNGYGATSMNDIAAAVGISKAALYKHYEGKEDILDTIIEECTRNNAQTTEIANELEKMAFDNLADVCVFAKTMFRHFTSGRKGNSFRKLLTIEQYNNKKLAKLYDTYFGAVPLMYFKQIFTKILDNDDTMQLAMYFYGPLHTMYSIYDNSPNKEGVIALANDHIERFLGSLNKKK